VSENLCNVELFIKGRWSPASSGRTFVTTSNVNGRPIATVAAATFSDVDRAVDAAADAMDEWAATNPAQRRVEGHWPIPTPIAPIPIRPNDRVFNALARPRPGTAMTCSYAGEPGAGGDHSADVPVDAVAPYPHGASAKNLATQCASVEANGVGGAGLRGSHN
jgi:hypothetical protein